MVAASLAPLHPAAAVLLPRSTVPNLTCKLEHRQNHPGLTCPAYSARPGRPARPALHGLGAAAAAWLPRCPTAPPPRHPAGPANLPGPPSQRRRRGSPPSKQRRPKLRAGRRPERRCCCPARPDLASTVGLPGRRTGGCARTRACTHSHRPRPARRPPVQLHESRTQCVQLGGRSCRRACTPGRQQDSIREVAAAHRARVGDLRARRGDPTGAAGRRHAGRRPCVPVPPSPHVAGGGAAGLLFSAPPSGWPKHPHPLPGAPASQLRSLGLAAPLHRPAGPAARRRRAAQNNSSY